MFSLHINAQPYSVHIEAATYDDLRGRTEAILGLIGVAGAQAVTPAEQAIAAAPAQPVVDLATPAPRRGRRPAAATPATDSPAPVVAAATADATAAAVATPPATPAGDTAQSQPGAASSTAATSPAAPADATTTLTVDNCRAAMAKVNEKHGMQAVVDLLARYGAQRASMLKPEQFSGFIAEAEAEAAKAAPTAAAAAAVMA